MEIILWMTVFTVFAAFSVYSRFHAEQGWLERLSYCLSLFLATMALVYGSESAWKEGRIGAAGFVAICILLGTFQWAWYNVEAKRVLNDTSTWRGREAAFTTIVFLGAGTLLCLSSFLKGGAEISDWSISWRSGVVVPLILTGAINIVIMLSIAKANSLENLMLVAPIETSTPAPVIFFGILILGERPLVWGWLGIIVLAVSTYSLGIVDLWESLAFADAEGRIATLEKIVGGSRGTVRFWFLLWFAPLISLFLSRGARWAAGAAFLGLISSNFDALVFRNANIGFAQGVIWFIVAGGNYAIARKRKEFEGLDLAKALRALELPIALMACLCLCVDIPYRAALMSHVASLKRLAVPFTMIGAYYVLGERKNWRGRVVSGLLMTSGVVLIGIDIVMRKQMPVH